MATESSGVDVEAEIDRLYQLPLEAFVEARNALAARAKAGGDKGGAARVKALVRPNTPAWAANQVYWQARREFDALLASVERLQGAQVPGALGGALLREAMKARREAQDLVLRSVTSLLTSAGYAASPATLLKVSNTLEALAARGSGEARPGRLAQELEPPGFDAFAGLGESGASVKSAPAAARVAAAPSPLAAPAPAADAAEEPTERVDERAAERERLRAALAEGEKRLDRARREAREATGAHAVAQKRAEAARAELEEATRRLERAQERAAVTAEDEVQKAREAGRLAASQEAAEADRDAALRALRAVE